MRENEGPVMSRRKLLRLLAAGSAAPLLAACGAAAPAAAPTAAPAAAPTAAPAAAPTAAAPTAVAPTVAANPNIQTVEIEIGLPQFFAADTHPTVKLIEAFNAQDLGVRASGVNYGQDYQAVMQRTQANISARIAPAIAVTGWKYAAFADAALDIVDFREVGGAEADALLARYPGWVVDIVRVNDKIAGLPFALSTPVLYYNRDLFKQAGLDPDQPPTTWAEVAEAAAQLKANAGVAAPLIGGINEWTAQSFIQNAGGRVLDDGGKAAFDTEAAIAGMQAWTDLREQGHYVVIENAQQSATFTGGSAAMNFTSIAGIASLRANATFDLGTAEFPSTGGLPKRMPSGGNFLGVYAREDEQRQGAWAFLSFVNSPEGIAIWNESGYLVASNDRLPPLPGQEPAYRQLEAGLTNETIWPGPRGLEALSVFNDWVSRIVRGDVALEEGMRAGTQAVAALLP